MATTYRHRKAKDFDIHEDDPTTEDADADMRTEAEDDEAYAHEDHDDQPEEEQEEEQEEEHEQVEDDEAEAEADMSEEEELDDDMRKLQTAFNGFKHQYRLIKRIGEGTFSTVYKAQDLQYDRYDNNWDLDKENEKWSTPPLKSHANRSSSATLEATLEPPSNSQLSYNSQNSQPRRPAKYVAIKKIYVTSSPARILNELELLHDLRNCPAVCPLITAFRSTDQVIAILPYFAHHDFRDYFRKMNVVDMSVYLRSLFTALAFVHEHHIIHRDIKPTNFLYDPVSQRGVLVDFGLAEREGTDTKPCLCHELGDIRRQRLREKYLTNGGPQTGYPKNDTRPSRRANRAGTRGFRAPEVLFKCTEQTTKIDIWSAGVILLTILTRRFPFFNSADDVEAMIEIATIFGTKRMRQAAQLHGCEFQTSIPTVGQSGFDLGKIIMWSTMRKPEEDPFDQEERVAIDFLTRCMDLDPARRIGAEEALGSEFLKMGELGVVGEEEEEDMDILEP